MSGRPTIPFAESHDSIGKQTRSIAPQCDISTYMDPVRDRESSEPQTTAYKRFPSPYIGRMVPDRRDTCFDGLDMLLGPPEVIGVLELIS